MCIVIKTLKVFTTLHIIISSNHIGTIGDYDPYIGAGDYLFFNCSENDILVLSTMSIGLLIAKC